MEICQVCDSNKAVCVVSVFIPGRDAQNIHNTDEIGHICNECTIKLLRGEVSLETPTNALKLDDLLGGL